MSNGRVHGVDARKGDQYIVRMPMSAEIDAFQRSFTSRAGMAMIMMGVKPHTQM